MDIKSSNISSQIANSIQKLNLTNAKRAFETPKEEKNQTKVELQNAKKDDIELIDKENLEKKVVAKNNINVEEIQKYASFVGENLSLDDINYGLTYGRSVIADYSA